VAVIAVGTARNVRGIFPGCRNAVVTGTAFAQYLCVINSESRYPYIRVVAILADVCCLHMREILTGRFDAVVTANAVPCYIHMIEICWQPADC
jgi:hypothetical protein